MRRALAILLILVCTVTSAHADLFSALQKKTNNTIYNIKQLDMSISIPQEMLMLSEKERNALDSSMNYFLYAYTPDRKFQVHVEITSKNPGINNLSDLSDKELEQYCQMMQTVSDSIYGAGSSVCSTEKINGISYVRILLAMQYGNQLFCEFSYNTIRNGIAFAISFDPELDSTYNFTQQSQKYINSIMKSVRYGK